MKLRRMLALALLLLPSTAFADAAADRAQIDDFVDRQAPTIADNATVIWHLAEVGFRETKSSALLQSVLRKGGFTVEPSVAGMPTAFVARYRSGPGPVIGILAEYDALPGLSQDLNATESKPVAGMIAAHGCGHNLLGAGAVGAAIAVREWMQQTGFKGEVRVYGSPAEEGGDGKSYLVRAGLFNDVDVVLHWHPNDSSGVATVPLQGNVKLDFNFHGLAAHAAHDPEKGRSALEGVELMDVAIAFIRQHMPDGSRIHGIVTNGGAAPNVVPDYAQSTYYIRNVDMAVVRDLQMRVQQAAQGAAMATGTKVDWEVRGGVYPVLINRALLPIANANLQAEVAHLAWTADEKARADAIQRSLKMTTIGTDVNFVGPITPQVASIGGSSDVGDISYVVPTVGIGVVTWPRGTPAHSWASAASAGSSFGIKASVVAAKVLANTAIQLMQSPELIAAAKAELVQARGANFTYKAIFGDRAPPLNYTDAILNNARK